jgi:hypothetical protein
MTQEELQLVADGLIKLEIGALFIRDTIALRRPASFCYNLRPNGEIEKETVVTALNTIIKDATLLLEKMTRK